MRSCLRPKIQILIFSITHYSTTGLQVDGGSGDPAEGKNSSAHSPHHHVESRGKLPHFLQNFVRRMQPSYIRVVFFFEGFGFKPSPARQPPWGEASPRPAGLTGGSDPYGDVFFPRSIFQNLWCPYCVFETAVVKNSSDPKWGESHEFSIKGETEFRTRTRLVDFSFCSTQGGPLISTWGRACINDPSFKKRMDAVFAPAFHLQNCASSAGWKPAG